MYSKRYILGSENVLFKVYHKKNRNTLKEFLQVHGSEAPNNAPRQAVEIPGLF